jgi:hypothetical protein
MTKCIFGAVVSISYLHRLAVGCACEWLRPVIVIVIVIVIIIIIIIHCS